MKSGERLFIHHSVIDQGYTVLSQYQRPPDTGMPTDDELKSVEENVRAKIHSQCQQQPLKCKPKKEKQSAGYFDTVRTERKEKHISTS
jgi:hypothetical protein